MLLLTEIESRLPDGIVCVGLVPPDHPLADGTRVAASLGIELAAQASAAYEASGEGRALPGDGYLVSIRSCRFGMQHLPAGRELRVTVRFLAGAGPLRKYRGLVELASDGQPVVDCQFATFSADRTRARESRTTDGVGGG